MKGAAELLGVSYGTLYGRYRQSISDIKMCKNFTLPDFEGESQIQNIGFYTEYTLSMIQRGLISFGLHG